MVVKTDPQTWLEELMGRFPNAADLVQSLEEAQRRRGRGARPTLDIHDHPYLRGRRVAPTAPTASQALAWNATTKRWEPQTLGGSDHAEAHTVASHLTRAHSELSDAPTSAHHSKYTDSEARTAVPYLATVTFGWDAQSPQVYAP